MLALGHVCVWDVEGDSGSMWGVVHGGRPSVWRAYIAPPVRIAAAYVGCRPRAVWATAARAVAMRVGIDAMRLLAECGQFPCANRRGQRYMQEVRFRFHNVCGMCSDPAREAYPRTGGDVCDVLVLAGRTASVGRGEQVELP